MRHPKIIASVINNYEGDQRVQKQIRSLQKFGFQTEVIATDLRGKPNLNFDYPIHIIHLSNQQGMRMYFEFNRKLYSQLMKIAKKGDILLANDVDALVPNYLVSKQKGLSLVFDSHEIFSEQPSLTDRKFKKKIWQIPESIIIPKLKYFYTVSEGYADWFEKKYSNRPKIIMNVPEVQNGIQQELEIDFPEHKKDEKILIYQGAINISRGIDKMIQAMSLIENVQFWIIGNGPKKQDYQQLTDDLKLVSKVKFLGAVSPDQLKLITPMADLGLSIEEDLGISYRYALPNKVFDYMHAGVPILGTYLPEIKRTIESYKIGKVIENHQVEHLAFMVNQMIAEGKEVYAESLFNASKIFNWANEEKKLKQIYSDFLKT